MGTHGITTYNPTTLEVTNQVSLCAACLKKSPVSLWGLVSAAAISGWQVCLWDMCMCDALKSIWSERLRGCIFLPLAVHSLGTCPHPSPVAARASVKLQSIAIRFEPLRPEKGHAKNSTAKRFRETTNPEIKLSLFLLLFSFTVKDSRTLYQKMPFTFEHYFLKY